MPCPNRMFKLLKNVVLSEPSESLIWNTQFLQNLKSNVLLMVFYLKFLSTLDAFLSLTCTPTQRKGSPTIWLIFAPIMLYQWFLIVEEWSHPLRAHSFTKHTYTSCQGHWQTDCSGHHSRSLELVISNTWLSTGALVLEHTAFESLLMSEFRVLGTAVSKNVYNHINAKLMHSRSLIGVYEKMLLFFYCSASSMSYFKQFIWFLEQNMHLSHFHFLFYRET